MSGYPRWSLDQGGHCPCHVPRVGQVGFHMPSVAHGDILYTGIVQKNNKKRVRLRLRQAGRVNKGERERLRSMQYDALNCRDPSHPPPLHPFPGLLLCVRCTSRIMFRGPKRSMHPISKAWLSRAFGYQFMIKALRPRIAGGIEAAVREADNLGKFRTKQNAARSVQWCRRGLRHCFCSCLESTTLHTRKREVRRDGGRQGGKERKRRGIKKNGTR